MSESTFWQAEFMTDMEVYHPWYGSCDGLGADGGCAECEAVRWNPGYAEAARAYWQKHEEWARLEFERRERRKARRRQARRRILEASV